MRWLLEDFLMHMEVSRSEKYIPACQFFFTRAVGPLFCAFLMLLLLMVLVFVIDEGTLLKNNSCTVPACTGSKLAGLFCQMD